MISATPAPVIPPNRPDTAQTEKVNNTSDSNMAEY